MLIGPTDIVVGNQVKFSGKINLSLVFPCAPRSIVAMGSTSLTGEGGAKLIMKRRINEINIQ